MQMGKTYFRLGQNVTVSGGPKMTGKIAEIRTHSERFDNLLYQVEYGDRIKATTGFLVPSLITPFYPEGSRPIKRTFFRLAVDMFVDTRTFEIFSWSGDDSIVVSTDEHSKECLQTTARMLVRNALWAKLYPDHCPHCNGQGYFYRRNEPCSLCIGSGLCPRCGQAPISGWVVPEWQKDEYIDQFNEWLEQELDCPHCGWQEVQDTGLIELEDCGCWTRHQDTYDYHRQEPESEITGDQLLEWIRSNLHLEFLR